MNNTVLDIKSLSKHYGRIRAVDELDLSVEKGSIYGILGPNGSGKTTTLGIICGVINPLSGDHFWFGEKPGSQSLKKIGAIIEVPIFYPYLSAVDNLKIMADIRGVSHNDIDRVLDIVDLEDRKHSKFKTYSLGMKQRLAIAGALLGGPEVLILDEPTNGLDPQGIAEIRNLILEIAKQGITIIVASHLLDEVQKICTHVAVLEKGKMLFSGQVSEVLTDKLTVELGYADLSRLQEAVASFPKADSSEIESEKLIVRLEEGTEPSELNSYLFSQGITIDHLATRKKSLEKYFLELLDESNGKAVKN